MGGVAASGALGARGPRPPVPSPAPPLARSASVVVPGILPRQAGTGTALGRLGWDGYGAPQNYTRQGFSMHRPSGHPPTPPTPSSSITSRGSFSIP